MEMTSQEEVSESGVSRKGQSWEDLVSTFMKAILKVMDLDELPKLKIQIESRRGLGWSSQVSPSTREGYSEKVGEWGVKARERAWRPSNSGKMH